MNDISLKSSEYMDLISHNHIEFHIKSKANFIQTILIENEINVWGSNIVKIRKFFWFEKNEINNISSYSNHSNP